MASSKDQNRPLGLQRLSELDVMEVHSTKVRAGSQYAGQYEFKERSGQLLFSSVVDPKPSLEAGFNISLFDANEVEVITLQRPKDYSKVDVSIQGQLVSVVEQKSSCLKPLFEVKDANGVPVFRLRGPLLHWHCFNFAYQLTTMDSSQPLGAFTKQWRGWRKGFTTTRNDFTVTFPRELDVKYKAACIGACVFIIHAMR